MALDLASRFFTLSDLRRCGVACKAHRETLEADLHAAAVFFAPSAARRRILGRSFVARQLAAITISRWWERLSAQAWLNCVARECLKFHAFISRLQTNYPPLQRPFGRGLRSLPRLHATRRPVRIDHPPRCPFCSSRRIDAACYYRDGLKIARSTPYLRVGCQACVRRHLFTAVFPWDADEMGAGFTTWSIGATSPLCWGHVEHEQVAMRRVG